MGSMNEKQSAANGTSRAVIMGRDGRHIYAARATASAGVGHFAIWWLRVIQCVWYLAAKWRLPEGR
jgi:hypothetical protein